MNDNGYISGWDIGGAHIKVARCDTNGNLVNIIQVPCPLWQGIEMLNQAIETVFSQLDNQHDLTAITMTGELVDIFANRQSGVSEILACVVSYINIDKISVYGANAGWLPPQQAEEQWLQVASRNWQATASLVAARQKQGILIDIGSTTCDIIVVEDNQEQAQGVTDYERQTTRELLYTGVIRTPLIALSQTAPFNGKLVSLAAEVFATTGDCWCLLEQIDPSSIQDNSADGKSWQQHFCADRIARLLGCDSKQASFSQWQQLAHWFAEQQYHLVANAVLHVISAHKILPVNAPIIGAGIGRFIAKECAQRLNRPYLDFHDLISVSQASASDHAPAVAVALLAQDQLA